MNDCLGGRKRGKMKNLCFTGRRIEASESTVTKEESH
jgi:hypothetical protein